MIISGFFTEKQPRNGRMPIYHYQRPRRWMAKLVYYTYLAIYLFISGNEQGVNSSRHPSDAHDVLRINQYLSLSLSLSLSSPLPRRAKSIHFSLEFFFFFLLRDRHYWRPSELGFGLGTPLKNSRNSSDKLTISRSLSQSHSIWNFELSPHRCAMTGLVPNSTAFAITAS